MPSEPGRLFRFGGAAFIASGVLFLIHALLNFSTGSPPSTGEEILAWVAANKLALSLISEVLFFASVSLVPAVAALYVSLSGLARRGLVVTGCGVLAVVVPIISVLLIVHGRLVYPVFGLRITDPAVAELVVALFFGGMHAVDLLMAGATLSLSLAMRRSAFGTVTATLGFAAAAGDVAASYAYLLTPAVLVACRLPSIAWLIALGGGLLRVSKHPRPEQSTQPGAEPGEWRESSA